MLRFLQRIRVWEYRQPLPSAEDRTDETDKARRLGYKQSFVIYRARVRRGGRKRPVRKGIVNGKPVHCGITVEVCEKSVCRGERREDAALRVLNSYWLNQDSVYKYYEVIMVDPMHKARSDPRINWIATRRTRAER